MTAPRGPTQDFNRLFLREHSTAASPCGGRLGGGPAFIQPDTIIPNAADPQGWNRYAYVRNAPLRYTDPTGHFLVEDDECTQLSCSGDPDHPKKTRPEKDDEENSGSSIGAALGSAGEEGCSMQGQACMAFPLQPTLRPPTRPPAPPRPPLQRWVEGVAGGFLVLAGLGTVVLAGVLVVAAIPETATIVGALLAAHQVPIGIFVGVIGAGITVLGGYLIYDAITRP